MLTLDFRSRFDSEVTALEPVDFLEQHVAEVLDAHGTEAGRAAVRLGLAPLTLDVSGDLLTFEPDADGLVVRGGRSPDDGLVVRLDRGAFSELMQDVASTFALQMTGRAEVQRGAAEAFVAWEPVLRCLLDGRAVYEPGAITFGDAEGRPFHLRRSFMADDEPEEMGQFLAEAGFLHLAGVFTSAEMAAVSAELDEAMASAQRDNGASWWARTESGEWYPSRILGFNQKSPTLRTLLRDQRFGTLGHLTDDRFVQRDPDEGDSAEGLLKKVGVVEGISDVSWHKDCAMGGHSRHCCGLTVGIAVTGAGCENGELGVVAGSHRANVGLIGIDGLDLPTLPLPTRPGDVTVHCSCTLHMSRQPVSAERRVVYTGFGLAPRPGERVLAKSRDQIRRERAALNDRVRAQQERGPRLSSAASFKL